MGRIKCEYCGSFIDDSAAKCPHCGAVNQHMVRYANKTPKTIDELKKWYTARNLPPENVTRFFIGKNVKEARAFGIYQEGSKFIVYKNKSDGTRAIRYEGNDETYAVNEIYMKLKEEILNQKNRNVAAAKAGVRRSTGSASRPVYRSAPVRGRRFFSTKFGRILLILFVLIIIGSAAEDEERIPAGYYTNGSPESVYYRYNQDALEWWHYEPDTDEWELSWDTVSEDEYPEGLTEENLTDYDTLKNSLGPDFTAFTSSRAYYDSHHPTVYSGYYQTDDALYYFHQNAYGSGTGWYIFDNGWNYLGNDGYDTVGDDVWYHTDDYYSGYSYSDLDADRSYYFSDLETWDADFQNTSFYEQYEADYSAYESTRSTTSSYDHDSGSSWDWDDDDDWDWDSGDSWDSGWSDWDSDW